MLKTKTNLTPRQVLTELDRYIIGQNEAKKAVAVALRNRYRRMMDQQVLVKQKLLAA